MATENVNKNKSKRTYILVGLGLGTLGLLGFGWWYFKGRKGTNVEDKDADLFHNLSNDESAEVKNTTTSTPKVTHTTSSGFPLKKGSRGALVKKVQEALIKSFGKIILPKYGADSQYGSELQTALKSKGFNEVIDLAEFTKITGDPGASPGKEGNKDGGGSATSTDAVDIAKQIFVHTSVPNLSALLADLKRIPDTQTYKTVNDLFKTVRLKGVRQTIVNGVLSSFTDDTSKQLLRTEFLRMGLKYDGTKWSLAGVFGRQIMTRKQTTINNDEGLSLEVPENTLLGVEIERGEEDTSFRSINNQILFVPTKHIRYA